MNIRNYLLLLLFIIKMNVSSPKVVEKIEFIYILMLIQKKNNRYYFLLVCVCFFFKHNLWLGIEHAKLAMTFSFSFNLNHKNGSTLKLRSAFCILYFFFVVMKEKCAHFLAFNVNKLAVFESWCALFSFV